MIRKFVSALSVVSLLLTACSKVNEGQVAVANREVTGVYATKVVNSSNQADENTLILVLNEVAAQTLSQGGTDEAIAAVCAEVGALSLERIFISNNDLARSKGLHKWYLVTFDGPRNSVQMAQKFVEIPSVDYVQYNTKVYRNYLEGGSSYHYEPKGYGDFNVPFNDPLLKSGYIGLGYPQKIRHLLLRPLRPPVQTKPHDDDLPFPLLQLFQCVKQQLSVHIGLQ